MLGLQEETSKIADFLDEHQDDMAALFDTELDKWRLDAFDVEDADIEVTGVNRVELMSFAAFGTKGGVGNIVVVGDAMIEADVSYTHPDWGSAIRDSEDGISIPLNDDISGETAVEIENVEFSMSIQVNQKGEPTEIEEIRITDDMGLFVTLHPVDEYK